MRSYSVYSTFNLILLCVFVGCTANESDNSTGTKQVTSPPQLIPGDYEQISVSLYAIPHGKPALEDGGSKHRFEMVKNTGIDFANDFDRAQLLRYIETGSGVALGDYDNDGLTDVYLVATDGPNKLYRCVGDFKFEDVTQEAGVNGSVNGRDVWGSGASFADIENDGDLDLLVCNMKAPNILYVNQGDGTFINGTDSAGIAYTGGSKVGSFCDYDRDGDLDLYLLTYQDIVPETSHSYLKDKDGRVVWVDPKDRDDVGIVDGRLLEAGERDFLFENNGDGKFKDVTKQSGTWAHEPGLSVMWFDHNKDNWPDIYIGSDFWQPDHLFQNNRDGTFTDVLPAAARHSPWFSMGSDAGDLNNDGWSELMIADMSSQTHFNQKLNMGGMSDSSWFLQYGAPRQYMRNALYINTGTGRFMESAFMSGLESTDWTWAIRFADLDNDGLQDIYVTNGHARDMMNADINNEVRRLNEAGEKEKVRDVNAGIPPRRETNVAFKNEGDFAFRQIAQEWGLDHLGVSHGVAFADFDADGDLDLIVNNLYEQATVYRNRTAELNESNAITVDFRSQKNNLLGYGTKVEIWHGDVHQTKTLTPVRGYLSSDQPLIHFGIGTASSIDRMLVTWPDGKRQEYKQLDSGQHYRVIETPEDCLPEVDVDQKTSIARSSTRFTDVAAEVGLDFTHKEEEFDDYAREPLLPYKLSQLGAGVAWGDINEDGYPDVYVGGSNLQVGQLFVNRGGLRFEKLFGPWVGAYQYEDMAPLFFDADGDGDLDLYVVSGSNEVAEGTSALQDRLYINQGDERFENAAEGALPKNRDSGSCVAAADFDRDGDLDLFVGSRSVSGKYPLAPTSRLLLNDEGKFSDVTDSIADGLSNVGMVNSALWSDFNGDGWIDLIVASDWGPVSFFKNENGKLSDVTETIGMGPYRGWWHGLAAGDFDGDGDLDYAATNQGLNTKYHADLDHPHRIYYDDFDGDGTLDLVEAEYEGDTEYPVRGLSCSSQSMPFIADKFGTYKEFAAASLSDIYEPSIESRPYLEVTWLSSSVIWNEGVSGMRVEALPRLAQISPGFGIEAGDFNADGKLDILLVNNFFGSQPETGFMDGGLGLLLTGDGKGTFKSVWPRESGVVLENDSMGLATADFDLDGDLDAIANINMGKTVLLRNNSPAGPSLTVKLKGATGNNMAVGAQARVRIKDVGERLFEVRSGGSYISQSHSRIALPGVFAQDIESVKVCWPDGSETQWESEKPLVANNTEIVVEQIQ
ncbi:FG-GAP-like repeat-containing protein [Mariniblastus fucicola]|uniref:FG-GAP-like repeat-containing protein n=1 Tax=Mariniblastus fucicola TaxID=980251 RepID=UPI0013902A02|nr:FG-GAP-like repeat-containing protein [Mariniblastus fucicola]